MEETTLEVSTRWRSRWDDATVVSARRRAWLRTAGFQSLDDDRNLSRNKVYNHLPAIEVENEAQLPSATCRRADVLFEAYIRKADCFKQSKVEQKRQCWRAFYHALALACRCGGCVRYSRSHNDRNYKLTMQVVAAAVEQRLCVEYRSPRGSPKMSRLLPLAEVAVTASDDPWNDDPANPDYFVELRARKGNAELERGSPISFDPRGRVPADVQRRLELINRVNADCVIRHDVYDRWEKGFNGNRRLRPVHHAVFTENFDLHGRLYTRRYGHQSLRKIERSTITFCGEQSIEYDFRGMHPRMLYHRLGIDYRDDPYSLWGRATTAPQRLLAKIVVNATINASSAAAAISACNFKLMKRTSHGDLKAGDALNAAIELHQALDVTGLTFKEVYQRAVRYHRPIKRFFASDEGIRLMRIDGAIALEICYHFATHGIPCLSCHDSFVVPRHAGGELQEVMRRFYRKRLGFLPVINGPGTQADPCNREKVLS